MRASLFVRVIAWVFVAGCAATPVAPPAPQCVAGETLCDRRCVDTQNDPLHCGASCTPCSVMQACNAGTCQTIEDCRMSGMNCPGLSYCEESTGHCLPGCTANSQCTGANETCNVDAHRCECTSGTHDCIGNCVANTSTATCGTSCTACPTDPNGVASCDGTSCALTCNVGSMWCGGACAACPSDSHITSTICGTGATCVVETCASGYMPCESGCCPITDCNVVGCTGFTYCDSSNGLCMSGCASSAQCTGGEVCDTSTHRCACPSGMHSCAGICASNTSTLTCGTTSCSPCATDPHGSAGCDGTSCTLDCESGTTFCSDNCAVCPSGGGVASTGCLGNLCVATACTSGYLLMSGTCVGVVVHAQQAYLKASNPGSSDSYGYSIALSADGNTLAVGAFEEDSAATGVGGDQTSNAAASSGAVYVLRRTGSSWTQEAYIKASNTEVDDHFGRNLALSADGNTLAAGAYGEDSAATGINGNEASNASLFSGAAYVFRRSGSTWSQQAYVKASNNGSYDTFGVALALSQDGNTLAVSATAEASSAVGINGNQASNGAASSGAVYVFRYTSLTWAQEAYVKASNTDATDYFGMSVALSNDGNTLAVGANGEDSSASGVGGSESSNASPGSGAVYVFRRAGTTWAQEAYVKASNPENTDYFGYAVALSGSGDVLAVGAYYEDSAATGVGGSEVSNAASASGAVYMFRRDGASWGQEAYVKASNTEATDYFGFSVAVSGDGNTLVVGAYGEDSSSTGVGGIETSNSANASGAVYVFRHVGSSWAQEEYVKSLNTGAGDYFGYSVGVSLDGSTVAAGAYLEDGDGATYVFAR